MVVAHGLGQGDAGLDQHHDAHGEVALHPEVDRQEEDADSDEIYQSARRLSHTFRDGLLEFFFDPESGMETLTKNYGVF